MLVYIIYGSIYLRLCVCSYLHTFVLLGLFAVLICMRSICCVVRCFVHTYYNVYCDTG